MSFILVLTHTLNATAQNPTLVTSVQSCNTCRIMFEDVAVLGDTAPDAAGLLPGNVSAVRMTSNGRFIVTSFLGTLPMWFDPGGEYSGDIGRFGDGPGEYRFPRLVEVSMHDSVFIYDITAARVSVLTPDLEYHRSFRLPSGPMPTLAFASLRTGSLVFNGPVPTPDRSGFPLHLLSPTGNIQVSFGTDVPAYDPRKMSLSRRVPVEGSDGSLWTGHVTRYAVERFNESGELIQAIRRDVDWFPEWESAASPTPSTPPSPFITALFELDDLLWVIAVVAADNWASGLSDRPRPGPHGDVTYPIEDHNTLYDTVIEVIDYRRGDLVASGRIDGFWVFPVRPGVIARTIHSRGGANQIEVRRLRLVR